MDSEKHKSSRSTEERLLKGGEITWGRTEDEVWTDLQAKLNAAPKGRSHNLNAKIFRLSLVASIAILLSLGILATLYKVDVATAMADQKEILLPDGSSVHLNADTELSYYPYRWWIQRRIKLEGEAFFQVKKGKKFQVISGKGVTSVMGTSFNIYARDENYRVSCLTGLVQVKAGIDPDVILKANQHVELSQEKLKMVMTYNVNRAISWKDGKFDFAGRPLSEVFCEIERQYDVRIRVPEGLSTRHYGGSFVKSGDVENVLQFVCKSMRLSFVKQSDGVFLIVKNG